MFRKGRAVEPHRLKSVAPFSSGFHQRAESRNRPPKADWCGVIVLVMAVSLMGFASASYSDTVILNSSERIKGVIVEDYMDRVVISTIDGEKEIMRIDIRNIVYDLEEQNLTKLGNFYQDKGSYKKAYYYYDKALKINPDYKEARDGLSYVGTYLQQAARRIKLDQVERRNEEDQWRRTKKGESGPSKEERILNIFGFKLRDKDGKIEIYDIKPVSPASNAGLREGDVLLEVWGRAVSYMSPEDVMDRLLVPGIMDVKATIERTYRIKLGKKEDYGSLLGAAFGFSQMEGLMFDEVYPDGTAEKNGIKEGDIVISLNGKATRYMTLEEAGNIIAGKKGDVLSLTIKRDMVIWKKFRAKQL